MEEKKIKLGTHSEALEVANTKSHKLQKLKHIEK